MTNHEEWDEFLDNLLSNAVNEYQGTEECEHLRKKLTSLSAQMLKDYPEEENPLIYKHVSKLIQNEERKNEFVYLQGVKDCVFLLKKLGILA